MRGGVKNGQFWRYIIYGQPLKCPGIYEFNDNVTTNEMLERQHRNILHSILNNLRFPKFKLLYVLRYQSSIKVHKK